MENLQDAGAVVTGAGHGIGRALASRLVAEGARVVVNDLDEDACRAVAEELGATAAPGDCSSDAGVRALVETATEALGRIDVYLANAGIDRTQPDSLQASDEDWAEMIDTNVMAHVRAARVLVPAWLADSAGRAVRGDRVGCRAAHDDRRRAVLGDQARRGRLRGVAVGDLRPPRDRRAGHLPAGRADPDARAGRPAQGPAHPRRRAHARPGRRRVGGLAGRGPVPGPPPPRGRQLLRRPRRDPDAWLAGMRRLQAKVDELTGAV